MPPRSESSRVYPQSSLGMKPIRNRNGPKPKNGVVWLEDRQQLDGTDGLWRVHDDLYDLSDFIEQHPGGSDWLNLTKGTDITEAFEVHHLSTYPEKLLSKYHVRKAKTKRNSPFTFKEDGFYKTLKREVMEAIKTTPKQPVKTTAFFIDTLLVATFLFAILGVTYWNYFLGIIAGSLLCSTTIAAHNYFHQKDNFRMYYFNLSLMRVRAWRISHVLSHHLYTNTINDMEMFTFEPTILHSPVQKENWQRYGQVLWAPFIWSIIFHLNFIEHVRILIDNGMAHFLCTDLIPFSLPLTMYIFGGQSILATFWFWNWILLFGSFQFFLIGMNAAHHHPDIFHDGDTPRATENYDWGMSQLDAVMDRTDISGNHFLVLTNFGDHALHHFFPTLDHGTLEHLYPVFKKVMAQFDVDLRFNSQFEMIKGQFRQLLRIKPNPNPPDLKKTYVKSIPF